MSSGTKVYDSINQPTRFNAVLEAIAKTDKIIVLSGPEVSSGMSALSQTHMFSSNAFTAQMPLRTMITDCSTHDRDLVQLAEDQLASYNKVMAARRIQARTAPVDASHRYFHRIFQQRHVVKYLTTSFDALEVNKTRVVESKVVRMHGDNRFLRCSTPGCSGVKDEDVMDLDSSLLSGATLSCADCVHAAEKPATSRRPVPVASSYHLRPAVQGSLGIDMLPGGKLRSKVIAAAESADLLLITGIYLQSDEIMDLVRELAEQIHGRYGGVVYIGPQPIRGRTTKYYVDFHLKMDVNECAEQLLVVMDQIISNELESLVCEEEPENTEPRCYLCNLGLNECLLKCKRCGEYLCYTGPYPPNQTAPCIMLQVFRDEANMPPVQDEVDNFSCVYCWNHAEEGVYPHYVRPAPWVAVREHVRPAPRMVMIIYYLDQFWPQAKHLRNHVAGKWVGRGWSAHVEPVRLETLPEQGPILPNLPWEANTYNMYIVYITHGMSQSKTYQISPTTSYPACQFLDHTLTPARNLIAQARQSLAFFACCGHPFQQPQRVWELQLWLNRYGPTFYLGKKLTIRRGRNNLVHTVIGCLNEKLTPAFLVCFLGKLTTSMADDVVSAGEVVECWLSDDIAVSHTDLIYLEKLSPPLMWLFSPFDSRPLGKELPHLLSVCKCKREQQEGGHQQQKDRKVWRVSHNAAHGVPLNEVQVKVSCSLCRQMWVLPSEHLTGNKNNMKVARIINDMRKKSGHPLFSIVEMLPEAVEHIATVLDPSYRSISEELYKHIQLFKQNLDAMLVDKGNVQTLDEHHTLLKATKQELKVRKKKQSLATRNKQLRDLAVNVGLELVGHTKGPFPTDVYCMDANTHEKLDPRKMLIRCVDDTDEQSEEPTGANPNNVGAQTSVPPPAKDSPFGNGYVDTKMVLKDESFKVLDHGAVYGFARAPDGTYSMVFAVQFQSQDSLGEVEKEAVDVFIDFLPKAAAHAYEVKGNGAQNVALKKRVGLLYSVGWRPGTTHGEMVAVYAAQKVEDKHDPTHYIDLYDSQELVNSAWIVMQESLSPRAVLTTIDTLSNTAVPMFGSHSSDIASHGPSLGSNMAASQHDQDGNGFANKMHVDRDMDSIPEYYGKVFAFGQWIHVDKEGRLVEKERIKQAIPDGLFVIPGYKVAFDLGAATVIKAIWRGGMDMHGTTTSKVDLEQGITRWGMSIQTNRGLNQRMRSGKGHIFGVHERLHQYYNILSAPGWQ
ncbi:hypothetical protein RSAG8_05793, partial [Rhizoctonia solani AG-8 WAC10335]